MNFISKEPRYAQGGDLHLAAGERATAMVSGSQAGRMSPTTYFRVFGQATRTDDFYQSRATSIEYPRMGRGEYFGEVTLDGGPRSASVAALEDCRCAVAPRAELNQLLSQVPEIAQHVIRKLAHRVRALTEHMRDLALMHVYGRVARLLLDLAEEVEGKLVSGLRSRLREDV